MYAKLGFWCAQVAEERALAGLCGNPLCGKPFTPQCKARCRFRITAEDVQEVDDWFYCGEACAGEVHYFAAQLGDPSARLKPEALRSILEQIRGRKTGERTVGFGNLLRLTT